MIDSTPSMKTKVLLEGEGVAITPHCAVVTLSSKPPSRVLILGGIDGNLKIVAYKNAAGVNVKESTHTISIGSPVTSLTTVDNSPLVVVGGYDGSVRCIHISKNKEALNTTVLMNVKVSSQAVTKLCYQESTRKLAIATTDENGHQVKIVCLEPNNMNVIGRFETSSIDALTWGHDDFKLLLALDGSISCYNTIGMTFDNYVDVELLWNRQLEVPQIRQMTMNDAGNVLYAVDGKRNGFYAVAVSLMNTGDPQAELTAVYSSNAECSASYCLLCLDRENVVVGSVSGEVSTCEIGDENKWMSVSALSCAVTSLCAVGNGFVLSGMDGSLLECNIKEGDMSTSTSSSRWDYLVHADRGINQKKSNVSCDENYVHELYRDEYVCLDKDTAISTSKVKLLTLNHINETKINLDHGCVCLYSLRSTVDAGVSDALQKHEIKTLVDINELRMGVGHAESHIFVKTALGEAGLCNLTEKDAFMVVDSELVATKKNTNAELERKVERSLEMTEKLQQEIKQLESHQEHLQLQIAAALEEVKAWQNLRVSNHLRQVVDGKAVSEEKALTNSLDKLAFAEGFQKSQLQMYERESERLANQIKTTEAENELLKRQIQDAKEKIAKREMEYNSITEVKNKTFSQQDKMSKLMRRKRLADEVQMQEKAIAGLRSQLKALRARTFPHFD